MRIAILGTRGIPNLYGGFERCAEELAKHFVKKGHSVVVYTPREHPYKDEKYAGVEIRRIFTGERYLKGFSVLLFDFLSLQIVRRDETVDVVLELGYNPAGFFFPRYKRIPIVTNMDGLEWKRSKWNTLVKVFSRLCEGRAARRSSALIADNPGIARYLENKYRIGSKMIPYGADIPDGNHLGLASGVKGKDFFLIVARLEPENNIEMVIKGYVASNCKVPLVIVGNLSTKHGKYLKKNYASGSVRFVGGIYDVEELNKLRLNCSLYFHGHSVGGTNPSLLEAMGLGLPIVAHSNEFNRGVLGDDAYYFRDSREVEKVIKSLNLLSFRSFREANLRKITSIYQWAMIGDSYLDFLAQVVSDGRLAHQVQRSSRSQSTSGGDL